MAESLNNSIIMIKYLRINLNDDFKFLQGWKHLARVKFDGKHHLVILW